MVDGPQDNATRSLPFALEGSAPFTPAYYPENIRVRKQRELQRSSGFCGGQRITDNGAKNREIHISGKLRGRDELEELHDVGDAAVPLNLSTATWSGEVRVMETEVEGPVGYYPPTGEYHWEYTIDVVSTGRDEVENFEPVEIPEVNQQDTIEQQ